MLVSSGGETGLMMSLETCRRQGWHHCCGGWGTDCYHPPAEWLGQGCQAPAWRPSLPRLPQFQTTHCLPSLALQGTVPCDQHTALLTPLGCAIFRRGISPVASPWLSERRRRRRKLKWCCGHCDIICSQWECDGWIKGLNCYRRCRLGGKAKVEAGGEGAVKALGLFGLFIWE